MFEIVIPLTCDTPDAIEHDGKRYRPIAIRRAEPGDTYLHPKMGVCETYDCSPYAAIILKEVKPAFRTPTDEDAKRRPECDCWHTVDRESVTRKLVAVVTYGCGFRYITWNDSTGCESWRHCRIKND